MKKFLALFIAVLSVFCFSSCEDQEELFEYKYKLKGSKSEISKNIVIHEIDKNGAIIKKHSIYELKENEYSQLFTTNEATTEINIYFETQGYLGKIYVNQYEDISKYSWDEKQINYINLMIYNEITEEEYNFYVNQ